MSAFILSAADLATPIRAAIVGEASITTLLTAYKGSFPVFTRRPAPPDAPNPIIMISPDVALEDADGINDYRPIQHRDITIYGLNDTPAHYRTVEQLGYLIRSLFHSQRLAITVPDWSVTMINARGPIPAPVDDDQSVARIVMLTIQLARLAA